MIPSVQRGTELPGQGRMIENHYYSSFSQGSENEGTFCRPKHPGIHNGPEKI